MTRHGVLPSIAAVVLLGAIGCACGPVASIEDVDLTTEPSEESALVARLRDTKLPFDGFAPVEPGGQWRIGDELLYGVEYGRGERRERWILGVQVSSSTFDVGDVEIAVSDSEKEEVSVFMGQEFTTTLTDQTGRSWNFSSGPILVTVRTYDEVGEVLERNVSAAPEKFLAEGFTDACALFSGEQFEDGMTLENMPEDQAALTGHTMTKVFGSLYSLFQVLQKNDTLADILWRVIEKPSIFSVVARMGVTVNIGPDLEKAELEERTWDSVPAGSPTYRFPLTIGVNDQPALLCFLTVAESGAPLHAAAGLLAIDGRHPRDAERTVRVRLLASRRGDPPENKSPELETDDAD